MKMKHKKDIESFLNSYAAHPNRPLGALIGFYQGYYHNFAFSTFFYIIKHSPVWILPIATANIINSVTEGSGNTARLILSNGALLVFLLLLNIPMNYPCFRGAGCGGRSPECADPQNPGDVRSL